MSEPKIDEKRESDTRRITAVFEATALAVMLVLGCAGVYIQVNVKDPPHMEAQNACGTRGEAAIPDETIEFIGDRSTYEIVCVDGTGKRQHVAIDKTP